jgi:hypothetical protein
LISTITTLYIATIGYALPKGKFYDIGANYRI